MDTQGKYFYAYQPMTKEFIKIYFCHIPTDGIQEVEKSSQTRITTDDEDFTGKNLGTMEFEQILLKKV